MATYLLFCTVTTVMAMLVSFSNTGSCQEYYVMQAQLQNSLDCQKDSNLTFPTAFTLQHVDTDPGDISNCTLYKDQDASVLTQRLKLPGVPPGINGIFAQVFLFEDDACTVKKPSGELTPFTVLYGLVNECILTNHALLIWEDPRNITFRVFNAGPHFCNPAAAESWEYILIDGLCASAAQHEPPHCPSSGCSGSLQNTVMAGVGSLRACIGNGCS